MSKLNNASKNVTGKKHDSLIRSQFHIVVKPVGSACNINCSYCFYLHKEKLLKQQFGSRMDPDLLENYIIQHIESHNGEEIIFSWQGGEPTLPGIKYYENIVRLQQKHCPPGRKIANNLQTNGTLLTDDWCIFLKKHDFLVGISIDGPEELHNACRKGRSGQPTFDKVMRGINLLKKYAVPFNTLTVINRYNSRYPHEIYSFLRDEVGSTHIQLIPCVEPKTFNTVAPHYWPAAFLPLVDSPEAHPGNKNAVVTDWSIDPDDWGYFLSQVFDDWFRKDLGTVLVNLFETAVVQTMNLPAQICTMAQYCGKSAALEYDGSVYACDHYAYPEYKTGNIREAHLSDIIHSVSQQDFSLNKSISLPRYCKACKYLSLCWGECPRNRFLLTPDGETGLNYLCSGLIKFFSYAESRLKYIASHIQ